MAVRSKAVTNEEIIQHQGLLLSIQSDIMAAVPPAEIQEKYGISAYHYRNYREEIAEMITERFQDDAEVYRALTYARLERLYRVAESRAIGSEEILVEDEQEPDGFKHIQPGPDRHWMKQAIDILKLQVDIMAPAAKQIQEIRAQQNNNTTYIQQTIISGDDLYSVALQEMQETWLSGGIEDFTARDLVGEMQDLLEEEEPLLLANQTEEELRKQLQQQLSQFPPDKMDTLIRFLENYPKEEEDGKD